jgi:hypothetical protein
MTKKILSSNKPICRFGGQHLISNKSNATKATIKTTYLISKSFSKVTRMASKQNFEQTATSIAALGRHELKRRIRNFKGRFRLDFTDDYLNKLSVDRLRHILLAASINARPHR